MPLLESAFASRPAAEWVRILTDNDIPAALTQSLQQFMRDPAVLHHKMVVQYDHPELGPLSLMGQPLRAEATWLARGRTLPVGLSLLAVLENAGTSV